MSVKWFEGIPWDEKRVMEVFERDLLPFYKKHGSMMGEKAMLGDRDAEAVIRRYKVFEDALDPWNLEELTRLTKVWSEKERL